MGVAGIGEDLTEVDSGRIFQGTVDGVQGEDVNSSPRMNLRPV